MNTIETAPGNAVAADTAGLVASIACAIHCAAMPIVIGYLPLLGLSWLADAAFHRVMALVCFALAMAAFVPGWRRHGSVAPALFGVAGVGLLAFAAFGLEGGCCEGCATAASAPQGASGCSDSACVLCQDEPTVDQSAELITPPPTIGRKVVPFLTPLGGVLLVAGHLVNRRKACGCRDNGCCLGGETP